MFDILIITASSEAYAAFWRKRLASTPHTIPVVEDWPGGAGNGLGTLYAYKLAREKGKELYGIDIAEEQKKGASLAIYHTAGKGMRLYPLAAAEKGNKSAIRLPAPGAPTLLEAVIRQTASYAPYRKGRLSVFWSDQLFSPAKGYRQELQSAVDILCMPLRNQKELSRYGLIGVDGKGEGRLFEKLSDEKRKNLKQKEGERFFISLGSFSLSFPMTKALLEEFSEELREKRGQLGSDLHFWMPLTLDKETFCSLVDAPDHYDRMQTFKKRFHGSLLFTASDSGEGSFWWDFGTVQHFFENNRKLLSSSEEGAALRRLYGIEEPGGSLLIDSDIGEAEIENSILVGVRAGRAAVKNSLLIDIAAESVEADAALAYHVRDEQLRLGPEQVRADVDGTPFYTELSRCGKEDWKRKLPGNPCSYSALD